MRGEGDFLPGGLNRNKGHYSQMVFVYMSYNGPNINYMDYIESGYFYDVYDVDNGRVLKKRRRILSVFTKTNFKNIFLVLHQNLQAKKHTSEIKTRLDIIPEALLGNPIFVNKFDYSQDKVLLLGQYFETHSVIESKLIVDAYVSLLLKLLKYGVHDYVYKFKNSYGVDKDGEVIFIDFNEITTSKEEVLKLVSSKRWLHAAQYLKFPAGELKEYIKLKLGNSLTKEAVEDLWEKSLL